MSWSVQLIGKPENIVTALDEESAKLDGESKAEFDAVLPALKTLAQNNFSIGGEGFVEPLLRLEAAGHGHTRGGERVSCSVAVKLESLYGRIV